MSKTEFEAIIKPLPDSRREITGLALDPIDLNVREPSLLPISWISLITKGFHDDLLLRGKSFMAWSERERFSEACMILDLIGEGFLKPFDANPFYAEISEEDSNYRLKIEFVDAIKLLAREFGDRMSSVVWRTLAFMGTREDPLKEVTIVSQADRLTLPWPLADAVLHSLGKVYGLKDHISSRIGEKTNYVLEHNCDCNHALKPLNGGEMTIFLTPDRFPEATAAFLSHLLSETVLIYFLKLPFDLGITPETTEAMAS